MKKQLNLCMIWNEDQILLGMKKRGFGNGRWNGFGGKLSPGESVVDGAIRELKEEIQITAKPADMEQIGLLDFEFQELPEKNMEVHVFRVKEYAGTPVESEEMKPKWFNLDSIPFSSMWSDDEYWFPLMLANKKFKGMFLFDRPSDAEYSAKVVSYELAEVSEF